MPSKSSKDNEKAENKTAENKKSSTKKKAAKAKSTKVKTANTKTAKAKSAKSKSAKKKTAAKSDFKFPSKEKLNKILDILAETHPDAKIALTYENPLELVVATILSAQCTDERVNKVTPVLFERYKTAEDYANADIDELKEIIRSTGFFNQKSKFIKEMATGVVEKFGGKVPDNMNDLTSLQGVARKTANVVLSGAYGKSEGVVVDTHVKRLSQRLGFTNQKSPEKIEKDLMELIPRDKWIFIGNALIFHGRRICNARKPDCPNCPLNELCPMAFNF